MSDEPAFPHPGGASDFTIQKSYLGMTLRDYFAAKAIPYALARERSLIDRYGDRALDDHVPKAAREAYRIADAMLAARSVSLQDRKEG